VHCRCQRIASRERRGRGSVAQRVTGIKHERAGYAIEQVEEFRASDEQGTVAKYLSDGRGFVARERGLRIATRVGRRGYVPLASRWRCGLGMTLSHSTQRTMPALCSASETQSEIRRLCIQARGGLVGGDCSARPDCSRFMVHLQGSSVEWLSLSLRAYNQHCVTRLHACGLKQPDAEP
jgi:hypothetical protein